MTLTDVVTLAVPTMVFACGIALLSHRFFVVYKGWSMREFSYGSHVPGILGTASMLFAILSASSLGWAYAVLIVLVGFAVAYLYVYVFRMWVEAALLGPILAVLSILKPPRFWI
jgi:membrane-bound ClpP family serine protease